MTPAVTTPLPPLISHYTIIIIQLSPAIISSQRMTPPTTISCLRCTDLGRECCVRRRLTDIVCRSTYLCIECDAAGIDSCVFPPSLRHLRRIKSACSLCMHVHHKCIFVDDLDTQCIRCTKRGPLCVFELNGMLLEYYYFIFFCNYSACHDINHCYFCRFS